VIDLDQTAARMLAAATTSHALRSKNRRNGTIRMEARGETVEGAARRRPRVGRREAAENREFNLLGFFPYRLASVTEQVSLAVAAAYATRFGLGRPEWRVLAALGSCGEVAATDIGRIVTLDKMQISRAVRVLEQRGLVSRSTAADRRRKTVALTRSGRTLYRRVVPLARRQEAAILADLSPAEVAQLGALLDVVARAAARLRDAPRGAAAGHGRGSR
jgi:DNA-binding MarR family transcriptional regulator